MPRPLKLIVALLVLAGAGLAFHPLMEMQFGSPSRSAYFERGKAYAPRLLEEVAPLPPELRESSGLAVSRSQPGVIWSQNDSGDAAMLYAIDLKGRLLAKVTFPDVKAVDWEDIAAGPCPQDTSQPCLYVADTGNNGQSRDVVTIFIVREPVIAGANPTRVISAKAVSFRFRYPGAAEDTEALAVLPDGGVTIVPKGRTPKIDFFGFTHADIVKALMTNQVLTATDEGDSGIAPNQGLGRWVTSAAISPDGRTLAVRTYSEIFFYSSEKGPQGQRWRDLGKPCFLGDIEPQGEAIDYLDEKTLLIGSETAQGRAGVLHRVQCQ